MILRALAPAKINLFLDVGPAGSDGYHPVCTIMQTVSLYDVVTVEKKSSGILLQCPGSDLPCDEKNLAYRAAQIFFRESGLENAGVSITIEKNIPIASGLAGGSTDAGAVLLLLNTLFQNCLSQKALLDIGGSLGADVPFCMTGGTALCKGRGEIIVPMDSPDSITVVIARGGADISTAAAYRLLDKTYEDHLPAMPEMWRNIHADVHIVNRIFTQKSMFNIFESVILPGHKEAAAYKSIFENSGAIAAMMSGSGPAVFGLFKHADAARHAMDELEKAGAITALCETCAGPQII